MGDRTEHHSTDWRVVTVNDPRDTHSPDKVHTVAVKIDSWISRHQDAIDTARIEIHASLVPDHVRFETDRLSLHVARWGGSFSCSPEPRYKLTNGGVYIEKDRLKGLRLGTYLMNEIVKWAKEEIGLPGGIEPITLAAHQAKDPEARERRNRFYGKFGITFKWTPTEDENLKEAGGVSSDDLTLAQLRTVSLPIRGITSRSMPETLRELLISTRNAQNNAHSANQLLDREKNKSSTRGRLALIFAALCGILAIGLVLFALSRR